MTGDMWDAVEWRNLIGKPGAKAGYMDGPVSMWPAEAWQAFHGDPLLTVTVLADGAGQAFDVERGNASAMQVAGVQESRLSAGLWSVTYVGWSSWADVVAAMRAHGLTFTDRAYWPKVGIYLWPTDPSGNLAAGRWVLPVAPIAIQDGFYGGYDHSTTWQGFPALPATPKPQPEKGYPDMFIAVAAGPEAAGITAGDQFAVGADLHKIGVRDLGDSAALQSRYGPAVTVSAAWLASLPDVV